jgi:hypothetical protein
MATFGTKAKQNQFSYEKVKEALKSVDIGFFEQLIK